MMRDLQTRFTRRDWLRISLRTGVIVAAAVDRSWWPPIAFADTGNSFHGGKKIGDVDFVGERPFEMNTVIGTELDGRLYTDISNLSPEHPLTPTDNFYVRTCGSKLLEDNTPWAITLRGLAGQEAKLSLARLTALEKPMGVHVMECVGNQRACHFGLMSAASWAGVGLSDVLNTVRVGPRASHVLISGFDRYETESVSSIPGASWIFNIGELKATGAFLATRMNREKLPRDHGAPVRLVVPGWYGCACIKWVNEIALVTDDAPATAQMKEYAERTGQEGIPSLAREYLPAAMDYAAIPIRIERWLVSGGFKYRVVGFLWGGSAPVKKLEIRFNPEDEYVAVDHLDPPGEDSWRFWTHTWVPRTEGTHLIRLRVADAVIQTKRLESGRYERAVVI